MNLLITYTHHSELQVITALSLISTFYKSPQHPLSLFQPAVSSSAVPWQRLLTVEIFQLHTLRPSLHSLPCRTHSQLTTPRLAAISHQPPGLLFTADLQRNTNWAAPIVFKTSPWHGPHRKHSRVHCCRPTVAAS
jgi:hypothetical protein